VISTQDFFRRYVVIKMDGKCLPELSQCGASSNRMTVADALDSASREPGPFLNIAIRCPAKRSEQLLMCARVKRRHFAQIVNVVEAELPWVFQSR